MSDRQLVTLGWLAATISVLIGIGAVTFVLLPPRPGAPGVSVTGVQIIADAGFAFVSPLMGLLIIRAQPRNVIGWLFVAFSALLILGFLGDGAARHLAPTPALAWAVTFGAAASNAAFLALVLLVLNFPTGRLLSPAWRIVPLLSLVGWVAMFSWAWLVPLPLEDVTDIRNPIAHPEWDMLIAIVFVIGQLCSVLGIAGAVAHMVVRVRRARGIERQQLKWFGFAVAILGGLLLLAAVTEPIRAVSDALWAAAFTAFPLLPIAAAIAILRHRLFDIDLIIKRTVSYAALSVVLVGSYAVAVLLLQMALAPLTQQADLAVAGSTLAVAALFQPARRRIQRAVDHRFDRARYDASRIMDEFGGRLRDGLDFETVAQEMIATVRETMRPASASVWLRPRGDE
jgi:hypothetical protein